MIEPITQAMIAELSTCKYAHKHFIGGCYDYLLRKGYAKHPKGKDYCIEEVTHLMMCV